MEVAACIRLEAGNGPGDGFRLDVRADAVSIRGESPRGALNGVYALLEKAGFAWVEPGDAGVCLRAGGLVPDGVTEERPVFERRTLILGQDALHDDWRGWMEWASRNRLNDLFFHDTPPSRLDRDGAKRPELADGIAADGRGWMVERWDTDGSEILAAAAARGMTLQFGGHYLPLILPRDAFARHPDWFPLREGVRDGRYNLCTSSAGARAALADGARVFFQRFAGADVYHAWADDIRGGGWCECEDCRELTPSDQAMRATNVLAEALNGVAPGSRVAHLAYHDTLLPPATVMPAANVTALFAPRERCYAHGIADERCGKNQREYWEPYNGLLETFGNDRGRVQIFEYYSDAVLFKGLGPTHLRTLPADVRAYAAGASNLQNLMVGNRPWVGPAFHAWWMARCAWGGGGDVREALDLFCEAGFPANAAAMRGYYEQQERAYRLFLDLHDLEGIPRHDVLDFSDRPRRTLNAKAPEALEGALLLAECERRLAALVGGDAAETVRIACERSQAAAVRALSAHLGNRVAAWDAILDGLRTEAERYLAAAREALSRYEAWDEAHVPANYANLSRNMLRAMRYHSENIGRMIATG